MNKRALLLLILVLIAGILTSCFNSPAESSSSSGSQASASEFNPKEAYKEYGGTIDLRANADLSRTAYCVNDKDGSRVVVSNGTSDITAYTSTHLFYGTQWSPDGRYVSFYERSLMINRRLFICDTSTWKVIDTGVEGMGGRMAFYDTENIWSGDSSKILITTETGGGYYDLAAGKYVEVGQAQSGHYNRGFSFSPDSGKIAYYVGGDSDKPVPFYVYDIASGNSREICTLKLNPPSGMDVWFFPPVWLSDTEFLENNGNLISKIDITAGQVSEYIADANYDLYLSPDGKNLAYQLRSDSVTVIKNIATGAETVIQYTKKGTHPVWSGDSRKVLMCDRESVGVFGLDGKQEGEEMMIPAQYSGNGSSDSFSTPVYTKDGLWVEGTALS